MKNGLVINKFGVKRYYLNNLLHREDGPAVEYANPNGDVWWKEWWINGQRHREKGPAIEYANGDKHWYQKDLLHREDGPAMESYNGSKLWYYKGKFIRSCFSSEDFETCQSLFLRDIELIIFS